MPGDISEVADFNFRLPTFQMPEQIYDVSNLQLITFDPDTTTTCKAQILVQIGSFLLSATSELTINPDDTFELAATLSSLQGALPLNFPTVAAMTGSVSQLVPGPIPLFLPVISGYLMLATPARRKLPKVPKPIKLVAAFGGLGDPQE